MMSHNTSVELSEQQENLNQSIMHMHNTAIYCVRYHYAIVYYEILDLFWIFIVSCGLYMCIEKWNLRTCGNAQAFILVQNKKMTNDGIFLEYASVFFSK
jgi:hypothetical protein